jgi:hypothetical protein
VQNTSRPDAWLATNLADWHACLMSATHLVDLDLRENP